MKVEYRGISGFSGYKVGSDGSIWSCRPRNGIGPLKSTWRQLKPNIRRDGYARVCLQSDTDGQCCLFVHSLVLDAFSGDCPSECECRHLDGCRTNNAIDNLKWGTRSENYGDRIRHGTSNDGENNYNCKIPTSDLPVIKSMVASGKYTQADIARKYSVVRQVIWGIVHGKHRKIA